MNRSTTYVPGPSLHYRRSVTVVVCCTRIMYTGPTYYTVVRLCDAIDIPSRARSTISAGFKFVQAPSSCSGQGEPRAVESRGSVHSFPSADSDTKRHSPPHHAHSSFSRNDHNSSARIRATKLKAAAGIVGVSISNIHVATIAYTEV